MAEREFKGVWIPREIWLDERLNALDKIILAEIDSLDNGDEHCHAGNDYLAQFCQCSASKVTKTVSKLIELGYVTVHSFDGRIRRLRSCMTYCTPQSSKIYEADEHNVRAINISINPLNKDIPRKGEDSQIVQGFEEFWATYPKKCGKKDALKAWKKLKPNADLQKTILADIRRRVAGEWKDRDRQYIKNPASYLNGELWTDEQPEPPKPEPEYFDWQDLPQSEIIRRHEEMAQKERIAMGLFDKKKP